MHHKQPWPFSTSLEFPDPRLRTIAKPVTVFDAAPSWSTTCSETMYTRPASAWPATQVNVHKRVVVMDLSEDKSEPRVFINPEFELLTEGDGPVPGRLPVGARLLRECRPPAEGTDQKAGTRDGSR